MTTGSFDDWQADARRRAEDVARATGWQLLDGWAIGPVGQHRDGEPLDQSNFAAALRAMGGEGDDVEVVRFSHWAVGWVEEVAFRMSSEAAAVGHVLAQALEECAVLDEDDWAEREWEADHPYGDTCCYSDYCHEQGYCSMGRDVA